MDIFATACEAAGVKPPPGMDAMSFLPDLLGQPQTDSRLNYYFVRREGNIQYNGDVIEALIQGDWKLVKDNPSLPFELFDLKSDPQESDDLKTRNKGKFAALSASLRKHVLIGGETPWQKEVIQP
jgi:arylsulfatase A